MWDFAYLSLEISRKIICFPFYFLAVAVTLILMSSVLFLVDPVSIFSHFMLSLCRCANASSLSSMQVSTLPPLHDTYYRLISSLVFNAFCMVISFLVLRSPCWSYFLVHFKKDPEYLTSWYSFLWGDSCCWAFFREVSSFVWDTLLFYFSFIDNFLRLWTSNIPEYL